jgi:hypothetical protein
MNCHCPVWAQGRIHGERFSPFSRDAEPSDGPRNDSKTPRTSPRREQPTVASPQPGLSIDSHEVVKPEKNRDLPDVCSHFRGGRESFASSSIGRGDGCMRHSRFNRRHLFAGCGVIEAGYGDAVGLVSSMFRTVRGSERHLDLSRGPLTERRSTGKGAALSTFHFYVGHARWRHRRSAWTWQARKAFPLAFRLRHV